MSRSLPLLALALSAALAPSTPCQIFVDASSKVPNTGSFTQEVDLADVDLDGDWDAMLADGGDLGNDQNRLYVNQGFLQGGPIGTFLDATAAQCPVIADDSYDVEFVDFDGDGDPDLYVANTADLSNQSDRWWVNLGGLQGGTAGFYADETSARWVGLGGPGSSVPASLILPSGGFIDWCADGDFADYDADGDLDLVHSTRGNVFAGTVPTRLFLNDGSGYFSEFNPSGFMPTGFFLSNGQPALWAEGLQQHETTDVTGMFADVAGSPLDVDLGDIDGDLDIDLLHGSRNTAPRMFRNRLAETGGLAFRDVTGAAGSPVGTFPAGYWSGGNNYDQEFGDMDRDGDLDILGVDWPAFDEAVFDNGGAGQYVAMQILASSGNDEDAGDTLDYDADGDLDLFLIGFGSAHNLYRNDYAGGPPGSFGFTFISGATSGLTSTGISHDADCADLDGDGDQDVLLAVEGNEVLYDNATQTPDAVAPYVPLVEQLAGGAAAPGRTSVRAQVYDNAAYYVTWYEDVALIATVDGFRLPDRPMASSMGQIFRGTLPANLVGGVDYFVRATDEQGNSGTSATHSYVATGGPVGAAYGSSSSGSLGAPTAQVLTVPYAGSELVVAGGNAPAGAFSFLGVSLLKLTPALDLGGGLIANLGAPLAALHAQVTDAAGHHVAVYGLPPGTAGISLHVQFVTLDGTGGNLFASSQGVEIQIL